MAGYEGAFNICAGIMGALMFIGILIYFLGARIRRATQRFAEDQWVMGKAYVKYMKQGGVLAILK